MGNHQSAGRRLEGIGAGSAVLSAALLLGGANVASAEEGLEVDHPVTPVPEPEHEPEPELGPDPEPEPVSDIVVDLPDMGGGVTIAEPLSADASNIGPTTVFRYQALTAQQLRDAPAIAPKAALDEEISELSSETTEPKTLVQTGIEELGVLSAVAAASAVVGAAALRLRKRRSEASN